MQTKFRKGDIIEILNLSKEQIVEILSQTNYERSVKDLCDTIIGSRYKILSVHPAGTIKDTECVCLEGWNQGGHSAMFFTFSQIRLYHREK